MYVSEKDSMPQEVIKTKTLRRFGKNWILTYIPVAVKQ